MKIVYDISSAQPQGSIITNGGGEYSIVILESLLKQNNGKQIDVLIDANKGTSKKIQELIERYSLIEKKYTSEKEMAEILNTYDKIVFPIFYPTYSNLNINKDKKIIGLIHDLSSFYGVYLTNNKYEFIAQDGFDWMRYIYKKLTAKKLMNATLTQHKRLFTLTDNTNIYTVSNFSKSALEYFMPECNVKDVFYSPNRELTKMSNGSTNEKYFLLVNSSRWAKNNIRVVMIFDKLFSDDRYKNRFRDYKVILTGCNESVRKFLNSKLKNKSRFDLKSFVSDEELASLYKNTYLFLYPSILEGFGYPPIEAMKYGTLCACSTSTSIPEVCGDAAIYFDPYDDDAIIMAIFRSFNQTIRDEKVVKIKQRVVEITQRQENDTNRLISIILDK
ncbi:glycosyltransferase [Thomasclavelia ramosa]|uniref:glycosyltransferase n=1 Tax=Thomasclavelia ramosa TaxID=1547 RepID=UPI00191D879B|nr:glycosyltransferase [Thomasclavelia ramosa]MCR1957758.1 glycosyltransferase [Thomasclavelia ramosa]QQV05337.1 glycosyltransferase [Thomasclavelia ramosa]